MKKSAVFSLLAAMLFAGCVSTGTFQEKVREVESLTAQKGDLQKQIGQLKDDLGAAQREIVRLTTENESLRTKVEELSPKAQKAEQLEKASQTYQDLITKLEKEIREGEIEIREMKNRLTMTMVDKILFPSGSAEIGKKGKAVLDKVIEILKDVKDKRIQVEGHTDNVPIVSALRKRFPTNWELSTARATEVVRYLQEKGTIDPKLLSATGFGEYAPVAPNDTEEGRHKNRRIEIVLLPLM